MINEKFFNIFSSDKDISEIFSKIISLSKPDSDSGNEIISFFETIPKSIIEKENVYFSKCFLNFFNKFSINEKNEKYYFLFNENFSDNEKNKIMLKNLKDISFENIKELCSFIKSNQNFDFYTINDKNFFLNKVINFFWQGRFH